MNIEISGSNFSTIDSAARALAETMLPEVNVIEHGEDSAKAAEELVTYWEGEAARIGETLAGVDDFYLTELREATIAALIARIESSRPDEAVYLAVRDQDVGTCEALRWNHVSIRPFVVARGSDEDEVREAAEERVGGSWVTIHRVG